MKFASLILVLASAFSVSAFAEVKPLGTFVPSLCSFETQKGKPTIDIVAVESVCMGEFVGMNKQGIQLVLNDGTLRNFEIKIKKNKGGMGAFKSPFTGVNVENAEETIEGNYYYSSGVTVTNDIELETSTNLEFKASLEMVFTTM